MKIALIVALSFLFACASLQEERAKLSIPKTPVASLKLEEAKESKELEEVNKIEEPKKKVEIIELPDLSYKESYEVSNLLLNKAGISIPIPKGNVKLSVENMNIYEFINLAFGKVLGLNYAVSPAVKNLNQKITLNMRTPMSSKQFFATVVSLLRKNGVDISYEDGIVYVDIRSRRAGEALSLIAYVGRDVPSDLSDNVSLTLIYPIYYQDVDVLSSLVNKFLGRGGVSISTIPRRNVLIISAPVNVLRKLVDFLNLLDSPAFEKRYIYLAELEYLDVDEFILELEGILKAYGIPVSSRIGEGRLSLVPIKRRNALLIVSPLKQWVDTVLLWKSRLDTLEALGDEPHVFVYKPKNRSAEELLSILKSVYQRSFTKKTGRGKTKKGKEKKELTSIYSGSINLTLDKERNALVIMSYPSEYKKVRRILKELDTLPKQVLIEVTIAELTLTDQLQFGFEWFLKHTGGGFTGELYTLGGLGIGAAGFTYSLVAESQKFSSILNMFAKKNLINIVSAPHVVVLDGREATINVGTEVPVVTSETTTADITAQQPSVLRNIQYRSTGVILKVKPVVISNNSLQIEVSQELSEAQTNTVSGIDSPLILKRSVQTSLVLKSGQSVLIGGLMSENKSKSDSGVPFLSRIPLLGYLFKSTSRGTTKTELIVMISPRIISTFEEMEHITDLVRDLTRDDEEPH